MSPAPFAALCGNTSAILRGEVWRLFTAPFVHLVDGTVGHIVGVLLGLYFLAPSFERTWGTRRLLGFLGLSVLIAYGLQVLIEALLILIGMGVLAAKLVPPYWLGGVPALEALVIAFATGFPERQIRLFFVIPLGGRSLVLVTIAISLLFLVAGSLGPSGFIAPFGGMFAGWLLGSTPTLPRKLWLKFKLGRLDREARAEGLERRRRAQRSGLRVLPGGKDDPPTYLN